MWPFAAGTGAPTVGVPLGRHTMTGSAICCDPISWFQRAALISNPSAFILAKPGLGKSTLVRRWCTGLSGYGVMPLVLGDLKPDYVDLIVALGGQVITLGHGRGSINVLDPGEATSAAARLTGEARKRVLADAHARRLTMVEALLTISRKTEPTDHEVTIIDRALRVLDEKHEGIPVLADLLRILREAPEDVRSVALDRGDMNRYRDRIDALEASLLGLSGIGRFGELFSAQTTNPMMRDRPVVYDVSALGDSDKDLQAAVLMACWSSGFATVNIANELAEAGLEPRRHYFVVLDELWRALRSGKGMVDRVDALTRLNRTYGVGQAMISHTMNDLQALATSEDVMKAKGFVERAGMVVCGGLPSAEMPSLTDVVPLSRVEQNELVSWTDPPAWDPKSGRESAPPGRGKFLIKVGGRPGIPVSVQLTQAELAVNNTNQKWAETSRIGLVERDDVPAPVQQEVTV
ncbi:ATP/GTP-binding protein [Luteipulveratus sp. YIM 133132]|uniref:ATP/GTP-binding protein n=2 Tax=Luteipulveratus flavus TaxID=3031728 RepID=A0ABT6C499_9MICO|nr:MULTISPECIES: ATP/GTP-binding protein [unclassified Luteipulveratus]MDE9366560.1 ATP/GTP-binding protein [Luteipulveratus sp. YIM 133132]MDF8263511.1 ATP/GTP-binding protein [Luteipulveratus sp. YIM 133296]